MVEMDSRLKGIILNHTLKSYNITPIESANVLRVTMKFYGGFKYKSPNKRRRDKLRKEKFLARFRRPPILVPIPFLEPGQSPSPAILGGPVPEAIITAFSTEVEELVAETKKMYKKLIHLAQEAEDAEKQRHRMCNWVLDLKDQKYDVQKEIWKLEQDLNGKKEELAQLEARKKELEASGLKGPIVTPSVLGLSQGGASAETRAPKKKKKNKPKRHPGLPSQEGQEYYKSYLAHL